jgi:hypothetical protein
MFFVQIRTRSPSTDLIHISFNWLSSNLVIQ